MDRDRGDMGAAEAVLCPFALFMLLESSGAQHYLDTKGRMWAFVVAQPHRDSRAIWVALVTLSKKLNLGPNHSALWSSLQVGSQI